MLRNMAIQSSFYIDLNYILVETNNIEIKSIQSLWYFKANVKLWYVWTEVLWPAVYVTHESCPLWLENPT